jgi:hypothetical protein
MKMSVSRNIVKTLGGAAANALVLAAGASTAAQMKSSVQNGDCKQAFETVIAPNANVAQALWTQTVAAKMGTKWAHWVGAKNKSLTPVGGQQFQARAKPCYYEPVL